MKVKSKVNKKPHGHNRQAASIFFRFIAWEPQIVLICIGINDLKEIWDT